MFVSGVEAKWRHSVKNGKSAPEDYRGRLGAPCGGKARREKKVRQRQRGSERLVDKAHQKKGEEIMTERIGTPCKPRTKRAEKKGEKKIGTPCGQSTPKMKE